LSAACGSTEDIGALSLVLQIIDASQELQQTVAHVKKLTPSGSAAAADAADKDQGLASTDQGSLVMQHTVSKFAHLKHCALHVGTWQLSCCWTTSNSCPMQNRAL